MCEVVVVGGGGLWSMVRGICQEVLVCVRCVCALWVGGVSGVLVCVSVEGGGGYVRRYVRGVGV